ncbi:ABC transporter [Seiridium cupressi]
MKAIAIDNCIPRAGEATLSWALLAQGKLEECDTLLVDSLAGREKALGKDDSESVKTGLILSALGSLRAAQDQWDESFDALDTWSVDPSGHKNEIARTTFLKGKYCVDAFGLEGDDQLRRGDFYALMFFIVALENLVAYAAIGWMSSVVSQKLLRSYRLEIFNSILQQDMTFSDDPNSTTGTLV